MNKSSGTAKLGVVLSIITILLSLFSLMSCKRAINSNLEGMSDIEEARATHGRIVEATKNHTTLQSEIGRVDVISYKIGGMNYNVFSQGGYHQGSVHVVNVTKDSLEVSKLIRESKQSQSY